MTGPQALAAHLAGCRPVQAALVADGSADDTVTAMLAAGWTLEPGTELVAGKRVRYLRPPAAPWDAAPAVPAQFAVVEDFLRFLVARPELLDAAPDPWPAMDTAGRLAAGHSCFRCAGVARAAVVCTEPPDATWPTRYRWLDLCWPCYDDIREAHL